MGLDMYLHRYPKVETNKEIEAIDSIDNGGEFTEQDAQLALIDYTNDPNRYIYHYEYVGGVRIGQKVGYWRKANQIHNWFVMNVQNGVDECQSHLVSKEQFKTLLGLCERVLEASPLVKGKVQNGSRLVNDKWIPIMEDGEFVPDPTVARELLPASNGCFFGSTNYDQWYVQDIISTIDILTEVLKETNWDTDCIVYCSSW